jgi:DNA-binding XRE family transcriptional regulator
MSNKLTVEQVTQIKEILAEDTLTQPEVAKKFGVSRSLISNIATGRAHKKIAGPKLPVKAAKPKKPETKIMELEAEVIHLREERNYARKQLLLAAKTQGLFQAMVNELEQSIQPFKELPKSRTFYPTTSILTEHLVLHLSDGHHDQIVVPEECGGLEEYNFPISICRAERLVDATLKWSQETLSPQFQFPNLTVLAYGDHTSGEIHGHVTRSYFRNQLKNCLAIAQLHSLMYRDFAPYFESINVVYVPGNHARRSIKKDYNAAEDSWDWLIAKTAELYCRDLANVHFLIPNSYSINLNIEGNGFQIFHGDDVRGVLGIPWYGLERRQRRMVALNSLNHNIPIKYTVCGHFHRPGSISDVGSELIINGSWVGTDAFAYNALASYSEPTQLLHGVNSKYGITWRLPIRMRCEYEKKGPRRYKIDLLN